MPWYTLRPDPSRVTLLRLRVLPALTSHQPLLSPELPVSEPGLMMVDALSAPTIVTSLLMMVWPASTYVPAATLTVLPETRLMPSWIRPALPVCALSSSTQSVAKLPWKPKVPRPGDVSTFVSVPDANQGVKSIRARPSPLADGALPGFTAVPPYSTGIWPVYPGSVLLVLRVTSAAAPSQFPEKSLIPPVGFSFSICEYQLPSI